MRKLYALLLRLEAILAGTFLLLMVALIFTGGVARLLHHPLNWTIDLATCFFAWACFLCADIAWRRDALMSFDILGAGRSPKLRRALDYCNFLILGLFLCYVIYAGAWLAYVSRARSFQGIPGVSYSWVTASLPVGAVLILITTVLKAREAMQNDGLLRKATV
jgi:TRAP-type C4-dicarboxylate transport system permease small subunit